VPKPPQPLVRLRRLGGRGRAGAELERGHRLQHRLGPGGREVHPQAEAEREDIPHGDRSPGRHGVVERAVRAGQHPAVGELGEPGVHGVVQAQAALLEEHHGGDGRDRLGHRRHPEDGVAAHHVAGAAGVHLAPPGDEPHQAGDVAPLGVAGHHRVEPLQPCAGQRSRRHAR
jgi:hypothetical protein